MKVTNTLVFLLTFATVQAQQTWSLEDCINHALVNNIALKQSELTIELNENTQTQSNFQLLPSVNANTSAFRNTGRYINPFTNQFIEEVSTSLNLSFSSNLTLFNGFKNINQIKKAANEVLKSTYDLESAKNELISSIALSYLQILFNEEAFLTSKEQFNLTNAQEARIKTLVDAGSLAKGELLNIQSQKALEEQQLVQTENQLNLSKLQLAQLLDLENYQELKIKAEIIKIPKLGVIGSHPTELPKYRGRAPIPWTILKGLKKSALTFFFIEEGMDDGDILDQQFFEIIDNDDAESLYEKMTSIGKTMLLKNLKLIEQGKINRIKQDPTKFIENWPKRIPEDGKINWFSSAESIHTLIRATTHPYPGAYTIFKTQKLIIWSASFIKNNNIKPGIILDVKKDSVVIGTGNGDLIVNNISIDGKSEINLSNIFTLSDMGKTLGEL